VTPKARAARVRLLVFDVDGVLTDGGLWYGPDGEALKRFDAKDGHGLVMARSVGLRAALLSGRASDATAARARDLRVDLVFQGRPDKARAFEELCAAADVAASAVSYMGDDVLDLPAMRQAGFAACPADAVPAVRAEAHWVAPRRGGAGAARDLVEFVLRARGQWDEALEATFSAGRPPARRAEKRRRGP
jgi:3-deoxy-D-manno-octulosonate 8-phosphate phosphatase (KDO 8-P phosphatase)